MSLLIAAAALYSRGAATVPADTAEPAMNAETTPDPEEQARQEAELFARDRDYLCVLTRAQLCAILKMEREHDEAGRTDDSRHGAERAVSESGKRL